MSRATCSSARAAPRLARLGHMGCSGSGLVLPIMGGCGERRPRRLGFAFIRHVPLSQSHVLALAPLFDLILSEGRAGFPPGKGAWKRKTCRLHRPQGKPGPQLAPTAVRAGGMIVVLTQQVRATTTPKEPRPQQQRERSSAAIAAFTTWWASILSFAAARAFALASLAMSRAHRKAASRKPLSLLPAVCPWTWTFVHSDRGRLGAKRAVEKINKDPCSTRPSLREQ